ncbi:MAG: aldo/keto reductase [Armatimonadia bacterium]|nr:aldo/keto reductase [Armatimonadia bacterium]
MKLRQIGTSEIESTPIVFGAWAIGGWLWGGTDDEKAIEGIHAGIDAGINAIDTAAVYGFGHSERVVGEAIAQRRDDALIFTKCGIRWDLEGEGQHHYDTEDAEGNPVRLMRNLSRDSILYECEQSLERLGIEQIDLYQCHWPDSTTPIEETMGAMTELLDQGLIRAIGVSNFTPEMIEECLQYGPVHCSQPKFSLLTRENLDDVIAWCHEHDIASIVYSPLEQGMLTGKVTVDREFAEGDQRREDRPWFTEENIRRVNAVIDEVMRPIAEAHDATVAQITLAWTVAAEGITCALAGSRNAGQASENAGAMYIELSDDEFAAIRDAFWQIEGP